MRSVLRFSRFALLAIAVALFPIIAPATAEAGCQQHVPVSWSYIGNYSCYTEDCYLSSEGVGPFTGRLYCFYDCYAGVSPCYPSA
jgi:hypothetical protein